MEKVDVRWRNSMSGAAVLTKVRAEVHLTSIILVGVNLSPIYDHDIQACSVLFSRAMK